MNTVSSTEDGGSAYTTGTPLLMNAETAVRRLGIPKSAYWLKEQARRQRIPVTRVGKTLMWSERDLVEIVTLLRSAPRNSFRP